MRWWETPVRRRIFSWSCGSWWMCGDYMSTSNRRDDVCRNCFLWVVFEWVTMSKCDGITSQFLPPGGFCSAPQIFRHFHFGVNRHVFFLLFMFAPITWFWRVKSVLFFFLWCGHFSWFVDAMCVVVGFVATWTHFKAWLVGRFGSECLHHDVSLWSTWSCGDFCKMWRKVWTWFVVFGVKGLFNNRH